MTTTTIHPDWRAALAAHAEAADVHADWPAASLEAARAGGALRWSIPQAFGGDGLDRVAQLRATERLASACLTTAFVLSQREAAIRWLLDPARTNVNSAQTPSASPANPMAAPTMPDSVSRGH